VLLGCGTCSGDCCDVCREFVQVRHGVREAAKFVIEVIRTSDDLFYFDIVRDGLAYLLCYISL
jgi:hypothetical protein